MHQRCGFVDGVKMEKIVISKVISSVSLTSLS